MLGILFGTFCLFALVKVARGRGGRGHGNRHGRYHMLRWVFRKLNTGPGQEKVVLGEVEALKQTTRGLRDEQFDRSKVDGLFRKQDELIAKLRDAASTSFEKVHAVLDAKQKKDLADMLERGWRHSC